MRIMIPRHHKIAAAVAGIFGARHAVPLTRQLRAVAEGLGIVAGAAAAAKVCGRADAFLDDDTPSFFRPGDTLLTTFGRALVAPALLEEAFWRGFLLRTTAAAFSVRSLGVNAAFAASHVVAAELRPAARDVFRDPAFLAVAFALGLACTRTYVTAGRALWAPIVVHAAAVTCWLTALGGERRLLLGHSSEVSSTRRSSSS